MADAAAPLRVFISYSSQNKKEFAELLEHLAPLIADGLIDEYHDQHLRGGDDWEGLLREYLEKAAIVLVLVSAEYLRSIHTMRELDRALGNARSGKARIVPVILEPCAWQNTPLYQWQALPKGARPVSEWPNRSEAFGDIANAIRSLAESLRRPAPPSRPATLSPARAAVVRQRTLAGYRFSTEAARVIAMAEEVQPSQKELTSEALLFAALLHAEAAKKSTDFFFHVVKSIAPLWERFPVRPTVPDRVEKLEPRDLTANATTVMEVAQHAAIATTGGRVISLRHLVFALIQPLPGSVKDDLFRQVGTDVTTLTPQYLDYLRREVPLPDELPAWERLVRRAATERAMAAYRPSYAADYVAATEDRLGFTKDARALASLIASSETQPPLSIGLFGDWGSGKSFFMRQIREMVADTAERAAAANRPTAYYGKIVQIEFNAWHYIEGNLWASLVEHIFSNLRLRPDAERDDAELERKRAELLKMLEVEKQQERAAIAVRDEAKKAADNARSERDTRIEERVRLDLVKTDWFAAFTPADVRRLGVEPRLLARVGKLREDGGFIARGLSRVLALRHLYSERHGRRQTLLLGLAIAAAIAILPAAAALVVQSFDRALIETVLAGAGTFLVTCQVVLTKLKPWIAGARRIADAVDLKSREIDLQRQQLAVAIDQEIAALSRDAEAAELKALQASQRIADLNTQIGQLSTTAIFSNFIEERASSTDYRRHLGMLANIRRDFERMARLLEKQRNDPDPLIQRIVLYIDDLDRCPAKRVVQVLQAIHLLLAFPVFVVVVGVDARWIARALQSEYDTMLGSDDDVRDESLGAEATAHDYLQKIFQVPFWIRPMNADSCRELLAGLTTRSAKAGAGELIAQMPASGVPDAAPVNPPAAGDAAPRSSATPGETAKAPAALAPKPDRDDDLNPLALHLLEQELELMNRVTPLLGRSPRAVKRFVNCYQLIKIGLEPSEIGPFLTDPAAALYYKPVMFLLAVVTGTAELGEKVLDSLEDPSVKAIEGIDALMLTWPVRFGSSFLGERELIAGALAEEAKLDPEAWRPAALQNAAHVVRRYSFRAGYGALRQTEPKPKKKEDARRAMPDAPAVDATP